MSLEWFRAEQRLSTQPRWALIARRCGLRVGEVLAVYTHMMCHAAGRKADERGTIAGWDDEETAILLGYEPEEIAAIREAMQGKALEGARLVDWDEVNGGRDRGPDEPKSTARVQAHRAAMRQKKQEKDAENQAVDGDGVTGVSEEGNAMKRHETPCNTMQHHETPTVQDSTEQDSTGEETTTPPKAPPSRQPDRWEQRIAAVAGQGSPPDDMAAEDWLACRFLGLRDQLWPMDPRQPAPMSTIRAVMRGFLADGGPPELVDEVIAAGMRKRGSGHPPPTSPQYFANSIAEAIASHRKAITRPETSHEPSGSQGNNPGRAGRGKPSASAVFAAFAAGNSPR